MAKRNSKPEIHSIINFIIALLFMTFFPSLHPLTFFLCSSYTNENPLSADCWMKKGEKMLLIIIFILPLAGSSLRIKIICKFLDSWKLLFLTIALPLTLIRTSWRWTKDEKKKRVQEIADDDDDTFWNSLYNTDKSCFSLKRAREKREKNDFFISYFLLFLLHSKQYYFVKHTLDQIIKYIFLFLSSWSILVCHVIWVTI